MTVAGPENRVRQRVWRGVRSSRCALAVVVLASLLGTQFGCATRGGGKLAIFEDGPLVRPELGAEYDVLVGEFAFRDGDFVEARRAFERAVEKDPESAYLHFRLARLAAHTDDLAAAVEIGERGLELDPEDVEGRLFLGRLYRVRRDIDDMDRVLRGPDGLAVSRAAGMLLHQVLLENGRLPEALAAAEQVLKEDPDDLGARMGVATVFERMGRQGDAERVLREALTLHPNRFVLYSRLARMRRASDDREGEVEIYREVLEQYPGHYGTLVSQGEAQIALNDIDAAIATYSEINALYPEDLQVVRRLASLEFAAGRYEESARRLRAALEKNPAHAEFAHTLGQVLRGLNRSDEAIEAFERIPPQHPLYVEARMQLAAIYEEMGNLDAALLEAEALRELRPERGLVFHVASLRARTGDFAGGVALLEETLKENPQDDEVLYQLGTLYGIEQDVDRALDYMQQVLERNPNNAHALNYIGYTWAERGENLEEAERLIKHALEISPRDGYIADSLAWVYYMRARPLMESGNQSEGLEWLAEARRQLDLAVELTGGDPVVSEHLGDVYLLMDDHAQALEYYEEAVELKPREGEQPELMNKLERLRSESVGQPTEPAAGDGTGNEAPAE